MITILDSLTYWHWLALGLVLLAAELLGAAGYLLWLGISALVVGALLSFMPMSVTLQWSAFAVFSLVTTWLWWRRQHNHDQSDDAKRSLNEKEKQLVGTKIILLEDIQVGQNRITIGDSNWTAQSHFSAKAGETVTIVGLEGNTLVLSKAE